VPYTDKPLTCVDCGAEFTFSAEDQEYYASRGFQNEPKRCPTCRRTRKAGREGGGGGGGSRGAAARPTADVPGGLRRLRPADRGALPATRRPPGLLSRLLRQALAGA
jgi:hypothetical protein